jgi:hypothetical protein
MQIADQSATLHFQCVNRGGRGNELPRILKAANDCRAR